MNSRIMESSLEDGEFGLVFPICVEVQYVADGE